MNISEVIEYLLHSLSMKQVEAIIPAANPRCINE